MTIDEYAKELHWLIYLTPHLALTERDKENMFMHRLLLGVKSKLLTEQVKTMNETLDKAMSEEAFYFYSPRWF